MIFHSLLLEISGPLCHNLKISNVAIASSFALASSKAYSNSRLHEVTPSEPPKSSTLSSREAGPEGGSGTLNFVVAFLVFPAGCIFVFPIFILGEFVEFHVFLPFFSYELACSEGNRMATHYRRLVW